MNAILRVHELVSISTPSKGVVKKVKVPFLESNQFNLKNIEQCVSRICSSLNNESVFKDLMHFLDTGEINYNKERRVRYESTFHGKSKMSDPAVSTLKCITDGVVEKSIIEVLVERSSSIHPTQKPVRLLERLLALTTQPGDIVLDPFSGSCSTAISCVNTNRKYIGFEIDKEYYEAGMKRLKDVLSEPKLAM